MKDPESSPRMWGLQKKITYIVYHILLTNTSLLSLCASMSNSEIPICTVFSSFNPYQQ